MMTTTKNSKRKNQPNGVDINQFPKLGAAIDEAVASGLLNGVVILYYYTMNETGGIFGLAAAFLVARSMGCVLDR